MSRRSAAGRVVAGLLAAGLLAGGLLAGGLLAAAPVRAAGGPSEPPKPIEPLPVAPRGLPVELARTLQLLQDRIARGSTQAHLAQRQLLGHIEQRLLALEPEAWAAPENVRAAVTFALSGGGPALPRRMLEAGKLPEGDAPLVLGALAYLEGREREARTAFARKDDLDSRLTKQYERIRAIEAQKADIEGLRERVAGNAAAVEAARKEAAAAAELVKRETGALELLRERVAGVEAVRKEVAGLEAVRERLAGLAADLKAAREEAAAVRRETENNKAADAERKAFRDAQAKQFEDALKDLQKAVGDCREKLARLEGAGGGASLVGPPAPKVKAPPAEVKPAAGSAGPGAGKVGPAGGPGGGGKPGPDDDDN